MPRLNVRVDPVPPPASIPKPAPGVDPLHHLLKVAGAQGASALYVAPQARPSLRVDGEIRVLDDAPFTDAQLEQGLRALMGDVAEGATLPLGEFETREISGVGRVQCLLFRDHRGLGAIFRMLPGRAVSAEQSGLSTGIQSLCTEPEGLLLVAGAHGAGKSTLVAALVDQINRTRRDHVITIESDIQFVHENRTSFVSQREARDDQRFLDAVRSAIREAPDVLVIDGVMSSEVAATALDAAGDGLVIASVTAPTTSAVLERFVSLFNNDAHDARVQVSEHLRGVVTQALLRKTGGGRAAAREVLVNVPSVASLIASGQFDQLPGVLNNGRRVGMVPLNDALLGLVQSGALDVRQAYRKSPDQAELVAMLNQAGFDTAFAERLT
jgi:twitching motility protein PilT